VADGFRVYQYVGPAEVMEAVQSSAPGRAVLSQEDISDVGEPFTFVVDLERHLAASPPAQRARGVCGRPSGSECGGDHLRARA
jgi:hypothetical protein